MCTARAAGPGVEHRASSARSHGSAGGRPPASANSRATHWPSSYWPRNRGLGTAAGSAAATTPSRRCMSGDSGLAAADTALRNARRPSASRSRQAAPGEYPPDWLAELTTADPRVPAAQDRIWSGSSSHGTRGMAGRYGAQRGGGNAFSVARPPGPGRWRRPARPQPGLGVRAVRHRLGRDRGAPGSGEHGRRQQPDADADGPLIHVERGLVDVEVLGRPGHPGAQPGQ